MAPSVESSSGRGPFGKNGDGTLPVPFPYSPRTDNDHGDGAEAIKFRPWRPCFRIQKKEISEKKLGVRGRRRKGAERRWLEGEGGVARVRGGDAAL